MMGHHTPEGNTMKFTEKLLAYSASILILFTAVTPLFAYDNRDIYVQSENFSYDLDLNAVASLFGSSKDLADFEWRLNDPYSQISNLDLNGNGEVDYLRIIETTRYDIHLIIIQAVIGPDLYQDVATIEVARDRYNKTTIQIVGDPYLYGRDYIIEPYYVYAPVIYNYFWGSRYYRPYYSRYRWGYYPRHYRSWRPRPIPYYNRHIRTHIDTRNHYRQTRVRKSHRAKQMHNSIRRNDYARKYPNRSYSKRQQHKRDKRQMQISRHGQSTQQQRHKQQTYNKNAVRKSSQRQQSHSRQQTFRNQGTDTRRHTQSQNRHQQRRSTQKRQGAYRHQNRQSIQTQSLRNRSRTATTSQRGNRSTNQSRTRSRTSASSNRTRTHSRAQQGVSHRSGERR